MLSREDVAKKVCVVIPVYNNADSLQELTLSLIKVFNQMQILGVEFHVLFVDDGSIDNSWQILCELQNRNQTVVKTLKLTRNFGQLGAMYAGFVSASENEAIVSLSADLQDPVSLIPELTTKWLSGNKLVIAQRKGRKDSILWKLTSLIAYKILAKDVPNLPVSGFDVFLMDREVTKVLIDQSGRNRFLQGDLLYSGFRPEFISYERQARPYGRSQYSLKKRFRNFVDAFFDSSYFLIRTATKVGVAFVLLGIAILAIIVYSKLRGDVPFQGYVTILSTLLVLGGIQITILGLISEYIWRIYDIARRKPMFVVEKTMQKGA